MNNANKPLFDQLIPQAKITKIKTYLQSKAMSICQNVSEKWHKATLMIFSDRVLILISFYAPKMSYKDILQIKRCFDGTRKLKKFRKIARERTLTRNFTKHITKLFVAENAQRTFLN